jgi:hypothetical protein
VLQRTGEERRAALPASPPLAIEREFSYDSRVAGGEATVGRAFDGDSGTHRLLAGVEFLETRVAQHRDGLQTDLATGQSTSTILGESLPVRDFPISRIREAGLYVQDEWRPGAGAWAIIPALRGDWYRLSPESDPLYAEDNPIEPPVSIEETSVSPKLGVARRMGGGTTAYLQYAHGFRAPPFDDVNIGFDLPLFNYRAIPNPDLESERSDSLELGLRFASGALQGSAAAFAARYRDFIESRVNIGVDPETGATLFQSQNLADAEIKGIEAAVDVALEAWHPALAGFTGHLSGSWTDGEDTSTGEPINSVDPPRGILGVRWESPGGDFGAGLEGPAPPRRRAGRPGRPPRPAPGRGRSPAAGRHRRRTRPPRRARRRLPRPAACSSRLHGALRERQDLLGDGCRVVQHLEVPAGQHLDRPAGRAGQHLLVGVRVAEAEVGTAQLAPLRSRYGVPEVRQRQPAFVRLHAPTGVVVGEQPVEVACVPPLRPRREQAVVVDERGQVGDELLRRDGRGTTVEGRQCRVDEHHRGHRREAVPAGECRDVETGVAVRHEHDVVAEQGHGHRVVQGVEHLTGRAAGGVGDHALVTAGAERVRHRLPGDGAEQRAGQQRESAHLSVPLAGGRRRGPGSAPRRRSA